MGNPATSGLVLHWCHHNPYTILTISTPGGYSVSVHLVDCPFLPLLIGWSSTSEKEAGWGHLPRSRLYTSPANRHISSSWNGKFARCWIVTSLQCCHQQQLRKLNQMKLHQQVRIWASQFNMWECQAISCLMTLIFPAGHTWWRDLML